MVATPGLVDLSSGIKPTKLKLSITGGGIVVKLLREGRRPCRERLDDDVIEVV
jgi:hypothetical protein